MLVGSILNLLKKIAKRVIWWCSVKKVFLKKSQNSEENTCAGIFFPKNVASQSLTL